MSNNNCRACGGRDWLTAHNPRDPSETVPCPDCERTSPCLQPDLKYRDALELKRMIDYSRFALEQSEKLKTRIMDLEACQSSNALQSSAPLDPNVADITAQTDEALRQIQSDYLKLFASFLRRDWGKGTDRNRNAMVILFGSLKEKIDTVVRKEY